MVQALRAKRKRQTRRLIEQPFEGGYYDGDIKLDVVPAITAFYPKRPKSFRFSVSAVGGEGIMTETYEPKYEIGDLLYVREPWRTFASFDSTCEDHMPKNLLAGGRGAGIRYEAGGGLSIGKEPGREFLRDEDERDMAPYGKFRQAMHMPRVVSRLTLVVDGVYIERLNEITDTDCIAEGIEPVYDDRSPGETLWKDYEVYPDGTPHAHSVVPFVEPHDSYKSLWEKLHGKGSWAKNPFIVAYSFTVLEGNIDRLYP
jgi:hypothetical protein